MRDSSAIYEYKEIMKRTTTPMLRRSVERGTMASRSGGGVGFASFPSTLKKDGSGSGRRGGNLSMSSPLGSISGHSIVFSDGSSIDTVDKKEMQRNDDADWWKRKMGAKYAFSSSK